jgi:non-ribosomal peptide synthetase component F
VFFDLRNALRRPLMLADIAVTPFGRTAHEGLPRLPVDRTWLTVTLKEEASGITGSWIYQKQLLDPKLLKHWISEYTAILTRAAANPELSLSRLSCTARSQPKRADRRYLTRSL